MAEVFPFLRHLDLPILQKIEEIDFAGASGANAADDWCAAFSRPTVWRTFTAPVAEDVPLLKDDPKRVRGQHYDVVVNGVDLSDKMVADGFAKITK
jgi:aspartyl-tRNA synthetase